jgi:hypothetical protein
MLTISCAHNAKMTQDFINVHGLAPVYGVMSTHTRFFHQPRIQMEQVWLRQKERKREEEKYNNNNWPRREICRGALSLVPG